MRSRYLPGLERNQLIPETKRMVKQLYLDVRALGYEGSYDRVAAFARQWKVDQLTRVNSESKGHLR
jgi:hypothetical protein